MISATVPKSDCFCTQKSANRRTLLFLLGPIFGVLIALMGIVYSTSYRRPWPLAVSLLGTMIASISLWLTVLAYRTNTRARRASYFPQKSWSDSDTGNYPSRSAVGEPACGHFWVQSWYTTEKQQTLSDGRKSLKTWWLGTESERPPPAFQGCYPPHLRIAFTRSPLSSAAPTCHSARAQDPGGSRGTAP